MKGLKKIIAIVLGILMSTPMISNSFIHAENNNVSYSEKETILVDIMKEGERSSLFNDNWKFNLGDVQDAYLQNFNDASWENVNLPHDYSISQDYTTNGEAESGFLLGGVGWYRKNFVVPQKYEGKQIFIEFDGVYMDSTIYVNGNEIGSHPYGYTPFAFDLTPYLICDGVTSNTIAVKVNHETPSSRWYSGSGIYRDVYITVCDKVHVGYEGTYIVADKDDLKAGGDVTTTITTTLVNEASEASVVTLKNTLANTSVSTQVNLNANQTLDVEQVLNISDYRLWSVDDPYMYQMKTEIMKDGKVIDTYETDFGFRYFDFVRETGFSLNGQNMKLKGVCMHHDQGALGAVANYSATYRQMKILKDMGCNSIRVTHNPASSVLIDICNDLGLLVIDEAFDGWRVSKNGNSKDYGRFWEVTIDVENNHILNAQANMTWPEFDIKAMVERGKNAPSIIMWSLGNEVFEGADGSETASQAYYLIARDLITWVQEIDTTRPVTEGDNRLNDSNQSSEAWKIANEIAKAGGIFGTNYRSDERFDAVYNANSTWMMYGSEFGSAIHSRGYYAHNGIDYSNLQVSDYDNDNAKVGWGASASAAWKHVITRDYNAGEYIWTGFDYLGEPTVWNGTNPGSISGQGAIPNSSFFGIVDTAGFEKDTYYLYQSLWNDDINTIHLIPHWNGNDLVRDYNGNVNVCVYSDAYRVELYVNDALVGSKTATKHQTAAGYEYQTFDQGAFYPSWQVPYQAGSIYVKAYDEYGNQITNFDGKDRVQTADSPAKFEVNLWDDELVADGRDLAYVEVDIVDANGNFVPTANNNVTFKVEGAGTLVGVDSGNASDLVGKKGNSKKAFSGKVLAIIQTTNQAGDIHVTMSANGLESKTIVIESKMANTSDDVSLLSYELSKHAYVLKGSDFTLPATLKANMSNGSQQELNIIWNEFDKSLLNEVNVFTLEGMIENSDIAISMNVHVVDEIAVMKSYAQSIAKNSLPTLPKTLPIVYYDGTLGEELPIEWDEINLSNFQQVGLVKVKGSAQLFDKRYEANAYIQVLDVETRENIASSTYKDAPTFYNGYMNNGVATDPTTTPISDYLTCLNNDITNDANDTAQRWTNWSLRNSNPWTYVEVRWQQEHTIDALELWHFKDSAASEIPSNSGIYFEAYNATSGMWERINETHITIVDYISGSTPYGFKEVVTTNKIRIWMQASASGKCIGLTEVKAYNYVAPIANETTLTIQDVKFDGVSMGYSPNEHTYYYDATSGTYPNIEIDTLERNKAITLTPVKDGKQLVIVESEDGSTKEQFTIIYQQPKVDKSTLKALISLEDNYLESNYSKDSYAYYQIMLKKAKLIFENKDANQNEVDEMCALLQAAMDQLMTGSTTNLINTSDNKDVKVIDFSSECDTTLEPDGIGSAASTLDKNNGTYWHSNWKTALGMPQHLTYDLGLSYQLDRIRLLPRQDKYNGDLFEIDLYVGNDSNQLQYVDHFVIDHGSQTYYDRDWKVLDLTTYDMQARYVKMHITSAGGDQVNQYCSLSEIEFYGNQQLNKQPLLANIQLANQVDETLYTKQAIRWLQIDLSLAQSIYDQSTSQSEVDLMSQLLSDRINDLALKQVVIYEGGTTLEGYIFAGYFEDEACSIASNTASNCYSKFVDEEVLSIKVQASLDHTTTCNLRFVSSVDSLYHQKVGFEVTINQKMLDVNTTTVYTTINSNDNGVRIINDPTICSYASTYFSTFNLKSIPNTNYDTNIKVTPYWITYDGSKIYGITREVCVNEIIE